VEECCFVLIHLHSLDGASFDYYYYYYAAFNAPCVGHKADESQARLTNF